MEKYHVLYGYFQLPDLSNVNLVAIISSTYSEECHESNVKTSLDFRNIELQNEIPKNCNKCYSRKST